MTKDYIYALDCQRQEAIDRVRNILGTSARAELAIKEIAVNYSTLRNWLRALHTRGYSINADLSAVVEAYNSFDDYRSNYNHIAHHLWEMRNVPAQVENGTFKPRYAHSC